MTWTYVLFAWLALSFPAAIIIGHAIAFGMGSKP
jgi:hypothetical protein